MLRPRESHELRLVSSDITIHPPAVLSWAQDVFGNTIATAGFSVDSDRLVIESASTLDLTSSAWPVFPIAARAITYPFSYSEEERTDLGALVYPQFLDATGRLWAWVAGCMRGSPTDTLALLKNLNIAISATASYQAREDEGTQTPSRTLDLGRGCCRDFAVLFVEAARSLGFGARIVSGYVFNPAYPSGEGTTHAWAEVFVPGAGWITFDPTNRQTGGFNLIPVAVARDLGQAVPVSGTFTGASDDRRGLSVSVRVTELN
jgi:transglutaminase-like putative cysteine protease